MFSLSKLNLQCKKNSKIVVSDFQNGTTFAMLSIYESSISSDTDHFTFIQQNSSDGSIKIKKLIWISESIVYSMAINYNCDWMAVSLRGGVICILPLGALMGRVQKRCEHWKINDVTYLSNKLRRDTPVTCMKWWTSSKNKNTCLIGTSSGDFIIIDLANGSLLYSEQCVDHICSIDLLLSVDGIFSYVIVSTKDLSQWKLLLEEVHNKEALYDKEFGFEALDLSIMASTSILELKSSKKTKDKHSNPTYEPTKFYQFSESTYLKSQSYKGKYFIGAYDRLNGKYKLFDCSNLDSSLYEFQLPLHVLDICVTEELIFLIVESVIEMRLSDAGVQSVFQEKKPLKLCAICRQFAQSHLFDKYQNKTNLKKQNVLFKPSNDDVVPFVIQRCVLFEFELENLYLSSDVVGLVNFPFLFNLFDSEKMSLMDTSVTSLKNTSGLEFIKQIKGKQSTTISHRVMNSKWSVEEIKQFTPILFIGRTGISICHLNQCFEDKFIDYLLEYDISKAEWLGAGLRLDMNYLYQYTAQLLLSGVAQLNPSVKKSKKNLIIEFFDLGYSSIRNKLVCLSQFWPVEDCLQFSLGLVNQINSISPVDRSILSNSLIPMFGYVISDPVDVSDGIQKLKNKYVEKFRRFIVSNCFFNDFKAAKTMIGFGLVDEAFFIAKEKGCVLEVFNFLIENNYNTNWWKCFIDTSLRDMYSRLDMDFVLSHIGLVDLEIVARSDPKLIKSFAEFICQCFMNNIKDSNSIFSFKTTTHLCLALNPHGSIINSLFHIYSCTTLNDSFAARKEKDLAAIFDKTPSSSTESLTGTSTFSKTLKIRREIGPELLAFCLLVLSRDNQINENHDHIYFIQLYGIITSATNKHNSHVNDDINGVLASPKKDSTKNDVFETVLTKTKFKSKKNILSPFWLGNIKSRCLSLRNDLCISISVFDLDLFQDDCTSLRQTISRPPDLHRKNVKHHDPQYRHRCQINMLGFQNDKSSHVLLLPKSIENGREIIRQIALGKRHILILTDCGSLYGAGSNVYGQLGIEKSLVNETNINRTNSRLNVINPQPVFMGLKNSEIIVSVAAGDYHSGAIIVDIEDPLQKSYVYTWGWGIHGQLGHNDIENVLFPKRLQWDFGNLDTLNGAASDTFPIQITMGCYHSAILTNKGKVYSFGNNSFGQLGQPGIQKSSKPILIQNIPHVTIFDTKYFHTVCCTASNEIFTWGIDPNLWQNHFNESKTHSFIATPSTIPTENLLLNEKIVQISCGTSHTTILTESKLVYSFGANMWGQLGMCDRKEYNHLVEVKMPKPIDFISTDNGVTVGMHIGERSTKLMVWGRCSHPLVQDNIKDLCTDTVRPQLLVEYQHSLVSNLLEQNYFDIDSLSNAGSTILNKHQLMIFFRNCSKYIDQNELMSSLRSLKEYDIIADFYLINDMLIESFFWRIKSLAVRIEADNGRDDSDVIKEDIEIMFQFYIRVSERLKNPKLTKAIITMITGYFKKRKLPWEIYERICCSLISKFPQVLAQLVIKYWLEEDLTSGFLRDLLLNMTEQNCHESVTRPALGSIVLIDSDIQRFHDLIRTGNSETIYDAADDHKVVFFANCGHAAVVGRYREQQLKVFVEKLRRKQLNFSIQMVQRLYGDSTILPDCLECLFQRI